MAIVSSSTLNMENKLPGDFNMDRQRSYVLEYNVRTTGIMGPIGLYFGALLAAPHPIYDVWQTYGTLLSPVPLLNEYDLDAFCTNIKTAKVDPKLYKVICNFATLPRGRDRGEATVNPMTRPVRYRGAKLVVTKAVTSDKDGKPLTTSAGEEFEEPLEQDLSYAVLVAVRNVASLDVWVSDMATYINSVNKTNYRTLTARKWWCIDIEISDLITESGYSYYQETWQIGMNLDTWDEELLDRGWKVLEGDAPNQKLVNATDDKSGGLTAPVLLDGHGKKLAVGLDAVALKKRVKREVDWTAIPV